MDIEYRQSVGAGVGQAMSKTKRVVGLGYTPEEGLPVIVLKAVGPRVDQLVGKTLNASGPRLVRDAALLDRLYQLPVDAAIDPSMFQLVASLLIHVFAMNEKLKGTNHG